MLGYTLNKIKERILGQYSKNGISPVFINDKLKYFSSVTHFIFGMTYLFLVTRVSSIGFFLSLVKISNANN